MVSFNLHFPSGSHNRRILRNRSRRIGLNITDFFAEDLIQSTEYGDIIRLILSARKPFILADKQLEQSVDQTMIY
jgi:hypothetical protein